MGRYVGAGARASLGSGLFAPVPVSPDCTGEDVGSEGGISRPGTFLQMEGKPQKLCRCSMVLSHMRQGTFPTVVSFVNKVELS